MSSNFYKDENEGEVTVGRTPDSALGNRANGEIDLDDLEPNRVDYRINGAEYTLWEASAWAAKKYRNESMRRMEYDSESGRVLRVRDLASLEPLLVSMCLCERTDDPAVRGKAVSEATIEKWTSRIQKLLFNKVMEISDGLREVGGAPALKQQVESAVKSLIELKSADLIRELADWMHGEATKAEGGADPLAGE